jgi:hypothetical protein
VQFRSGSAVLSAEDESERREEEEEDERHDVVVKFGDFRLILLHWILL